MRRLLVVGLVFAALPFFSVNVAAQGPDADVADQAVKAVENFIAAWNTADNVELRKAMHFPFVTMNNGNVAVAQGPADFSADFDGMKARSNWARSSLDALRVIHTTPNSAYLEIDFGRHNTAGERYFSGTSIYIVTFKDGEWRFQFREQVGDRPSNF